MAAMSTLLQIDTLAFFTFTKENVTLTIRHITKECYFTVGNSVSIQTIGISMGIDPSPFWANLTFTDLNVASRKIF